MDLRLLISNNKRCFFLAANQEKERSSSWCSNAIGHSQNSL